MTRLPVWADVVLVPLISLLLAAIVSAIVASHEGTVRLEPTLDGGATMAIELPYKDLEPDGADGADDTDTGPSPDPDPDGEDSSTGEAGA